MKTFPKRVIFGQVSGTKRGESLVLPCKNLILPISFLGKLVNQQGIVCNIYLQRVSFCTYLGGYPSTQAIAHCGLPCDRLRNKDFPAVLAFEASTNNGFKCDKRSQSGDVSQNIHGSMTNAFACIKGNQEVTVRKVGRGLTAMLKK